MSVAYPRESFQQRSETSAILSHSSDRRTQNSTFCALEATTTFVEADYKTPSDLVVDFFNLGQSHKSIFQSIDLVYGYIDALSRVITSLKKANTRVPQAPIAEQAKSLRDEQITWQLIAVLLQERKSEQDIELDDEGGTLSEARAARQIYRESPALREAQRIVEWAEGSLEEDPSKTIGTTIGKSGIPWENTLRAIHRGAGGPPLDPDGPNRSGKRLHDEDARDDETLITHILYLIRRGRLSEAQDLCRAAGQPWRAAILEGGMLYDPDAGCGNRNRSSWRLLMWDLCREKSLSTNEIALYGCISGNLPAILPTCNTWMEYIWAYFKVMVDREVERSLRAMGFTGEPLPADFFEPDLSSDFIFSALESSKDIKIVREGRSPYCRVQRAMISNKFQDLTASQGFGADTDPQLLRFLVHLFFLLRDLVDPDLLPPRSFIDSLVLAYIDRLQESKLLPNGIAWYVTHLPDTQQVGIFAAFLSTLSTEEERSEALEAGRINGIAVQEATKKIVQEKRIGDSEDVVKIAALDWLLMDLSSAEGALEEAMRLALDFLFAKKLDATRQLIEKLPPEWSRHSSRHPSAATLVLSHTLLLLLALEAHARWKAHLNLRPKAPAAPPSSAEFSVQVAFETTKKNHRAEDAKWKANLTFYAKNVVSRVHAVFLAQPCGWMWGTEQLNNLQLPAKYFPLLAEILLDVSEQETQLVDVASVLTFPRVREALSVSQMGSLLQHLEAKMKGTLESGGDPLLPDAV